MQARAHGSQGAAQRSRGIRIAEFLKIAQHDGLPVANRQRDHRAPKRFEVTAVVEIAGISADIHPITTADYPTPARRPAYSVLANQRWAELGQPPLREWRQALAEFIPELLRKAA